MKILNAIKKIYSETVSIPDYILVPIAFVIFLGFAVTAGIVWLICNGEYELSMVIVGIVVISFIVSSIVNFCCSS